MFKRLTASALLCIGVLTITHAQQTAVQMAEPFKHENKVYVDDERNMVFWPMALPMWVRLSPSPEPDAPSYLLKNMTRNITMDTTAYKNEGIQLDVTGRQYIRWFNFVTKDTLMLRFNSDGTPPQIDAHFENAPVFKSQDHTFYGQGLMVKLETTDGEGAGVSETYVSLDGAIFEPYRRPILFASEKEYNLRFYAVDQVGYASQPQTAVFTVDLTAPVSHHEILDNYLENVLSSDTSIRLISKDKLTGAQIFSYFDDPSTSQPYGDQNLRLDQLADGEHVLTYYAEDRIKNREPNNVFTFYLDKTPPQVTHTIEGDHHTTNDKIYISTRTRIGLAATDNKIGVDHIEYQINQGAFKEYIAPISMPPKVATTIFEYRATDRLKNESKIGKLSFHMDKQTPKTSLSFTKPYFEQRGKIWVTPETLISISSTDTESGVQNVSYRIDTKPKQTYSGSFSIAKEGPSKLVYWGIDNVNNQEEDLEMVLVVDNTPPQIIETFSITSTHSIQEEDGLSIPAYPRNTSIFLGSTDASSSTAGIWYTINGGKEVEYAKPLNFKKEGAYKIIIRAKDRVENTTEKIIHFVIQD